MSSEDRKKRKTPRLQCFDYSSVGVYFLTLCTQNKQCILSRVVGTGVPDCPQIHLTQYGEIAEKYINQIDAFYEHLSVESYVIMPNHIHLLLFVKDNGQSRTPVPTRIEDMADNGQSRTPVPTGIEDMADNGQSRTPVPTGIEGVADHGQSRTPVPTGIEGVADHGQSRTPVPTGIEGVADHGQSRTPVPTNITRANSVVSQFVSTFKRFCNKEYGQNVWQSRYYDHIIRDRNDYEEHMRYIYENPMRWYYDELYAEEC